jgi:predicted acyltransferase
MFLGNPADPYSLEGFWGTHVDRRLLNPGQIYKGEGVPFDPEGLISTLPAIVQVILGYLIGEYIRLKGTRDKEQGTSDESQGTRHKAQGTSDESQGTRDKGQGTSEYSESYSSRMYEMLTNLFVAGSIFIFAGLCWDMVFPINKKIWTSSYVLYTTGLATTILAIMIYLIEIKHYRGFVTRFFDVFGKNPLFIFVISGFLPRLLGLIRIFDRVDEKGNKVYVSPLGWFYEHICKPLFSNPNNGSLLYALCIIAVYWLIVYWLDRRRVYIKV